MERVITARDLSRRTRKYWPASPRGTAFVVVRKGMPVAEIRPYQRRKFVSKELLIATMKGSPRIDGKTLRREHDEVVDNSLYDPWERHGRTRGAKQPTE